MVTKECFQRAHGIAPVAASQTLSKASIDERLASWFEALNRHLPVGRLLSMLASEHHDMRFLGVAIDGHSNFEPCYEALARTFDERHVVSAGTVRIDKRDGLGRRSSVVGCQATWGHAPEARSRRVAVQSMQQWVVKPSSTGLVPIQIITCDTDASLFAFARGWSRLPSPAGRTGGSHVCACHYRHVPRLLDRRGKNYDVPGFGEIAPGTLLRRRIVIVRADGPELPAIDVQLHCLESQCAVAKSSRAGLDCLDNDARQMGAPRPGGSPASKKPEKAAQADPSPCPT